MVENKPLSDNFKDWVNKIDEEYLKQDCASKNIKIEEWRTICWAHIRSALYDGVEPDDIIIGHAFNKPKPKKTKIPFGILKITNYTHNVEIFYQHQQFFFDKSKMFWFWNTQENKWQIVDETDMMNGIDDALQFGGDTVNSKVKAQYLEAFKRVGRKNYPKELPKNFIQFKNKLFDINNNEITDATSKYFCCNPIPWDIGLTSETPTFDKLFEEWCGKEYIQTLYEILAYCCYTDYPMHFAFCLIGGGRNGKTQFQKIINRFVGEDNIVSSELDAIMDNRFESFKLYKKLVCLMGETNFGKFDKSSMFKKVTGGDLVSFEKKGKDPFSGYSYAKIIINSNSLPITEDNSEGFYRRWFIIDFPNNFKEGKDIVDTIPEEEYRSLCLKITQILPELLKKGHFNKQGTIEHRKQKYIEASNPISFFIDECCDKREDFFVKSSDLFSAYIKYLKYKKRRPISRRDFGELISEEGYVIEKKSKKIGEGFDGEWVNTYYVFGLELKARWEESLGLLGQTGHNIILAPSYTRERVENTIPSVPNVPKEEYVN